jgi:hypothetical protein
LPRTGLDAPLLEVGHPFESALSRSDSPGDGSARYQRLFADSLMQALGLFYGC